MHPEISPQSPEGKAKIEKKTRGEMGGVGREKQEWYSQPQHAGRGRSLAGFDWGWEVWTE